MNPAEKVLRSVDGWQQRTRPAAFLFAVQKKFGDDNAGNLASLIAYNGFLALFPLLLVAITVLGYVLAGDPHLRDQLTNGILGNFPIIGNQLHNNVSHPLTGNVFGLVVGVVGLVWGSLGVAQAAQRAMAEVWHIPQIHRPNFVSRLLRSLLFIAVLGGSAVVTTALSAAGTFGNRVPGFAVIGGPLMAVVANIGLYLAAFRVLTPGEVPLKDLWVGAVIGGIGWEILQVASGYLIGHNLKHASQVYGMFGLVLGLISWLYLGAQLSLYAAEVNVVRRHRLFPRALMTPPLTEADKKVYESIAEQERRYPDEEVEAGFDRAATSGG
ncbi:MAG TPA: YihY/virulence factor BrkB family protein [Acidimicrobiales bacterium]|nr:YihY/virulence factor BrkB family protein [Acidimicrobiales bacterium]